MKIQQLNKLFKKNESGRSMVEMLGVLAVIGVLSVGGIYGYKMAMRKVFENKFRSFFAHLYQAVQSAQMNPNTSLNCCSGNIGEGKYYNYCGVGNYESWFTEQYDEICSYLSPDDCRSTWTYANIDLMATKSLGSWQYLAMKWDGSHSMIGFFWQSSALKKDVEFLSDACENVLTDITSNPVYQEKLDGITKYRFVDMSRKQPTAENIKTVCSAINESDNKYVGFSIYFKNDNTTLCVSDDEE